MDNPPTVHFGSVKICGLRQPDHAVAAVEAGADLIGFVFARARRQVSGETAAACITAARVAAEGRPFRSVGVFVDASPDEVNRIADLAGLDLVQLHGDESPDSISKIERAVVKVLRPQPGTGQATIEATIQLFERALRKPIAYLIDGYDPDHHGGQGIRADWTLATELSARWPVILAGGLGPGNVDEAIATVKPIAVDVSSGVEIDGVKDPATIAAFVNTAKLAYAALTCTPRHDMLALPRSW